MILARSVAEFLASPSARSTALQRFTPPRANNTPFPAQPPSKISGLGKEIFLDGRQNLHMRNHRRKVSKKRANARDSHADCGETGSPAASCLPATTEKIENPTVRDDI